MSSPSNTPPAGTEARAIPVVVRSTVPATANGVLVLARIDAPTVGVPISYLVLDPQTNRLALTAPCGCSVHHELSGLVLSLAEAVAKGHVAGAEAASGLH